MPSRPRHVLPVVVLAQFAGTSVWFATNAVVGELEGELGLPADATVWLTGAVQLGFIVGTGVLSTTGLADRFSPRWLFLGASLGAALANLGTLAGADLVQLALARFATGVMLAGVYPIGMKVAAGWYQRGLGAALGWLVAALVLGTALPHLLRALTDGLPWAVVVWLTSALAAVGGVLLATTVRDGPHLKASRGLDPGALPRLWRRPGFRAAALGYFGHMWELYAFWAFLPLLVARFTPWDPSWLSGLVISAGAVGCVAGGYVSHRFGSGAVARGFLATSLVCCAVAPWVWGAPAPVVLGLLFLWGVTVVGDSPQLSTLTAQQAPPEWVGTGLAFATAVGFALTVVSLQVSAWVELAWLPWLWLPGPLLGLWALRAMPSAEGDAGA